MKIELEFCPKHLKLVSEKIPICTDCLKEKGYDFIENQSGVYINVVYMEELMRINNFYNVLKEDYSWSLQVIERLANFSILLKNIQSDSNEKGAEIVVETTREIGGIIDTFIKQEIENKRRKMNE